jgi:tripartite-type tricarboxylate transporter receptor subunit TctC
MFRFALAMRALVGAAALALPNGAVQAQTYPSKPIRLILPYVPGGIIDTAGRHLALRLSESLGQPVVVARSAADGNAIVHVPYRGIGAAYPDVMSGKVQLAFSSIAGAVPFTSDNRVRPLATTGAARSAVYPEVPTVAESGLPGFDVDLWIGIYAPAGLPPAVLAKLNGELKKVLQHPELKAALAKIGVEPRGTSPEEAAAFTRSEFEKWKKVIVDGNIKPE